MRVQLNPEMREVIWVAGQRSLLSLICGGKDGTVTGNVCVRSTTVNATDYDGNPIGLGYFKVVANLTDEMGPRNTGSCNDELHFCLTRTDWVRIWSRDLVHLQLRLIQSTTSTTMKNEGRECLVVNSHSPTGKEYMTLYFFPTKYKQLRPALRGRKETFTVWIPEELKLVRSHTLATENNVNSHPAVW